MRFGVSLCKTWPGRSTRRQTVGISSAIPSIPLNFPDVLLPQSRLPGTSGSVTQASVSFVSTVCHGQLSSPCRSGRGILRLVREPVQSPQRGQGHNVSRLLFVFKVMGPRARDPRQIRGVGLKGPIPAREGPLEGGGEQMQGSHCEAAALDRAGCL